MRVECGWLEPTVETVVPSKHNIVKSNNYTFKTCISTKAIKINFKI